MDPAPAQPSFWIRDIPVFGRHILSPMANFSDSPYRRITRELGSALSVTEFVSTEEIVQGQQRALDLLRFHEAERPIAFQIFGKSPEKIWEACRRIEGLGPDIIDLNMGCSTRRVSLSGSGAGLLRELPKLGRIVEGMRKRLSVPVTGKIRLGWDEQNRNYREIARVLEDSGLEALAVHGRTREQKYTGRADWEAIAKIVEEVSIPVIGNGDIFGFQDGRARRVESGVAAVMIGRAARGNPFCFLPPEKLQLRGIPAGVADKGKQNAGPQSGLEFTLGTIARHFELMTEHYGSERAPVLFRKHAGFYLTNLTNTGILPTEAEPEIRPALVRLEQPADLRAGLDKIRLFWKKSPAISGC